MDKIELSPMEALNTMCHVSERNFDGTVYTISDCRYPDYNGRQITIRLEHGRNIAEWRS